MKLLPLLIALLSLNTSLAQDIKTDKLPLQGGIVNLDQSNQLPKVWVIEREYYLKDAKAVSVYFEAPAGTRATFEVTALSLLSNTGQKKKRLEKRKLSRIVKRSGSKSFPIDFLTSNGDVKQILEIKDSDTAGEEGLGFFLPDACSEGKYLFRVVMDFQSVKEFNKAVTLEVGYSTPPSSQQTLFKFPAEKNPSLAVILMRTTGVGPEYLHFTSYKNAQPIDIATIPVDNYFFSSKGTFTRVYSSLFTGQRVSMHHISGDFRSIYSVCLTLQRKRQALEGY